MKPIKIAMLTAVIAVILCMMAGYFSYPIQLNMVTLPEHIKDFYNHGNTAEQAPNIVVYSGVSIGNKDYYLIEVGEDLGYVTLKKGMFGRYKIEHLGYGDGNFRDGIVEHNGRKYLLFGGRDISSQINSIVISVGGKSYELLNQNSNTHFLLHTELSSNVEDSHISRDKIVLYNELGEDITSLYDLSGGGIQ